MKAFPSKFKFLEFFSKTKRVTTCDAPFSSEIKLLIDNYFQIDNDGFQAPENQATLMLKSGYVNCLIYGFLTYIIGQ